MSTVPRRDSSIYCALRRIINAASHSLPAILLAALTAGPGAADTRNTAVILALGDSLTAGYGLDPRDSFPSQLEAALAQQGLAVRVINGGVSGDTSAGGLARVDWLLAERPELVIVELGANDGLRGLDPAVTRSNLDQIVMRIHASGAHVLLTGMRAPPNLGVEYGRAFFRLYRDLAEQYGTAYYPFFLEGVAANPALNQEDGIHPTAEGVEVIVENILPVVIGALAEARR